MPEKVGLFEAEAKQIRNPDAVRVGDASPNRLE
jgi:hypothetical protein